MEASTSRAGEIKLIIEVVATLVQKQQLSSNNNNMSRSYFSMHVVIPLRVRWVNVEPKSESCKYLTKLHRTAIVVAVYSFYGSVSLLQGPKIFSSKRINVS